MKTYLEFIDKVETRALPEAADFSTGFLVHEGREDVGLGIALFDENRQPIGAVKFTPSEAIAVAQYLLRSGIRLFAPDANGQLAARLEVQKTIMSSRRALEELHADSGKRK